MASNPALHIDCIRDRENNERVVHRKLLLKVTLLPLDVALDKNATCLAHVPSVSDLHEPAVSVVDTGAATANISFIDSVS